MQPTGDRGAAEENFVVRDLRSIDFLILQIAQQQAKHLSKIGLAASVEEEHEAVLKICRPALWLAGCIEGFPKPVIGH